MWFLLYTMATKTNKLDTVEELQKAIEENKNRVREIKRADSELRLQMAVKNMNSEDVKEQVEILRACYDYIAQHRNLYGKASKNKTPLPVTGAY